MAGERVFFLIVIIVVIVGVIVVFLNNSVSKSNNTLSLSNTPLQSNYSQTPTQTTISSTNSDFMAQCKRGGGYEAFCSCANNYFNSQYSASEIAQFSLNVQSNQLPQALIDATNACINSPQDAEVFFKQSDLQSCMNSKGATEAFCNCGYSYLHSHFTTAAELENVLITAISHFYFTQATKDSAAACASYYSTAQ